MPPLAQVMAKEFQKVMMPKTKAHTWPATTQTGQFEEFGATEWLFKFMADPSITASCQNAWLTGLVGSPGDVVAQKTSSRLILVLAVTQFTFAGWDLEVEENRAYLPRRSFSLEFHHVWDLEDWVAVPCTPCLKGESGPLMLKQTADAMSLPMAKIQSGLNLSVQQAKDLLRALGVPWQKRGCKSRVDS